MRWREWSLALGPRWGPDIWDADAEGHSRRRRFVYVASSLERWKRGYSWLAAELSVGPFGIWHARPGILIFVTPWGNLYITTKRGDASCLTGSALSSDEDVPYYAQRILDESGYRRFRWSPSWKTVTRRVAYESREARARFVGHISWWKKND